MMNGNCEVGKSSVELWVGVTMNLHFRPNSPSEVSDSVGCVVPGVCLSLRNYDNTVCHNNN